ncbi:hypothetical protein LA080_006127 [Diaporthe eres]|nr:hypothetical protein LA080_006127 [Diaporthe eres]
MQQPTEAEISNEMPYLPAEIIFDICGYFTVDPHNPAKGYDVSPSTRDNIRTLRQLSLTCRGIHDLVTPALYGSIYLTGPLTDPHLPLPTHCQNPGAETLVYFLRTILGSAKLSQYVETLACLIDLRDTRHFKEEMDTVNKDYVILSTIQEYKDIRTKRLLHRADSWIEHNLGSRLGIEAAFGMTSRWPIISISHQLFALLACLFPNVTSISLKPGSHRPQYPRSPGLYDFKTIDMKGRIVHRMTQPVPLANLRTLQVQCEPESTIFNAQNSVINLLELVPVLCNASNLTQVRCYGHDSTWKGVPGTVASFECWGPVSDLPLLVYPDDPMSSLKTMVVHLDRSWEALDFNLGKFCFCLGFHAPSLEHLEVLLSPGTCTNPIAEFISLHLCHLRKLQHFCFDTRFFSENHWDDPEWQNPEFGPNILPSSIETLRIVDSGPRRHFDSILKWLQVITGFLLRLEDSSKIEKS